MRHGIWLIPHHVMLQVSRRIWLTWYDWCIVSLWISILNLYSHDSTVDMSPLLSNNISGNLIIVMFHFDVWKWSIRLCGRFCSRSPSMNTNGYFDLSLLFLVCSLPLGWPLHISLLSLRAHSHFMVLGRSCLIPLVFLISFFFYEAFTISLHFLSLLHSIIIISASLRHPYIRHSSLSPHNAIFQNYMRPPLLHSWYSNNSLCTSPTRSPSPTSNDTITFKSDTLQQASS